MVEHFASIVLERWETDKAIANKLTAYKMACHEFKKAIEKKKKSDESKTKRAVHKNSIQKN